MPAKKLLAFVSILLITSCASNKTAKSSNATLVFAVDRQLTLEPCGCSFNPLGGLEAEYHLLQHWKKTTPDLINLNYGTTFKDLTSSKKRSTQDRRKAETLIQAMNLLEIQALGPSAEDLSLPVSELKSLRKASKFPWIATNLTTPLTTHSLQIQRGTKTIHIFHLIGRPTHSKMEWQPADEALEAALKAVPKDENHFTVVLSSLPEAEETGLIEKFKDVRVFATSKFAPATESIYFARKNTVAITPMEMGKRLVQIELTIPAMSHEFYHADIAAFYAKNTDSPATKEYASRVPTTLSSESTEIKDSFVYINRDWYLGNNPVTELLTQSKNRAHAAALKE